MARSCFWRSLRCWAAVGLAQAGALAAQEDRRSALEIFDAAMARTERQQALLRPWQYHSTLTTRQYDEDGTIVGKGVWRLLIRPGERESFQVLSDTREGKLTLLEDKPDEKAKKGGASSGPADGGKKEDDTQPGSAVEAVRKYSLRERYTWTRLPDGTAAGERAYVLRFEPRPGQSARSRQERFFSHLGGTIWISQEDFAPLKLTAGLRSTYRLFWIIARLTQLDLSYEVAPARGGERLFRLSRAHVKSTVSLPFSTVRQQHWVSVDRYEPRTARKD